MIKQEVKYILRSTICYFRIKINCHNSGRNLPFYLFLRKTEKPYKRCEIKSLQNKLGGIGIRVISFCVLCNMHLEVLLCLDRWFPLWPRDRSTSIYLTTSLRNLIITLEGRQLGVQNNATSRSNLFQIRQIVFELDRLDRWTDGQIWQVRNKFSLYSSWKERIIYKCSVLTSEKT